MNPDDRCKSSNYPQCTAGVLEPAQDAASSRDPQSRDVRLLRAWGVFRYALSGPMNCELCHSPVRLAIPITSERFNGESVRYTCLCTNCTFEELERGALHHPAGRRRPRRISPRRQFFPAQGLGPGDAYGGMRPCTSILNPLGLAHNFVENVARLLAGEGVVVAEDGEDKTPAPGGGQIAGESIDMIERAGLGLQNCRCRENLKRAVKVPSTPASGRLSMYSAPQLCFAA